MRILAGNMTSLDTPKAIENARLRQASEAPEQRWTLS